MKRSLLHPNRKNKVAGDELLIWSASSENISTRKKSVDMISSPIPIIVDHTPLTDVLSAAQALLPNQILDNHNTKSNITSKVPYHHIDTPSKPRQTTTTMPIQSPSTPEVSFFFKNIYKERNV